MLRVEKCQMCGFENLQLLKKYRFDLPKTKEYDDSIDDVTYKYERLLVFFNEIWKDGNSAEFDVNLCTSCGMIFTNPRFTPEEIRTKYKTVGELESAKKRIQKRPPLKVDERAKRIYSLIAGLQENSSKSWKILDYGGAQGYNLLPFLHAGNSCYLLDYVKLDYPKGINYLGRDVGDLRTDEVFDVIHFCHTLEHVIDPVRMINDLSFHLTKAGLLYVEVPLGCWQEWKTLNEPLTHVNFFSEESIFKCLRRAGLDIIHLSTAYQWVTHGEMWCINIVGKKGKGNSVTKFKTSQQQMNNRYYYLKPLFDNRRYYLKLLMHNPVYYLGKITKRILAILFDRD